MTDKELLELAAKAAGVEIEWHSPNIEVWDFAQVPNWNPLTDDGDALRLAVKLKMDVNYDHEKVGANCGRGAVELLGDDPCAATRRAIVRAAAEIGKNK